MNEKSGYRNGQLIYPISVLDHKEEEGGGGGMQPGPNTVGTEQIVDDSIEMEDLSHNVKDKMLTGDNRVTQEELDQFEV